VSDAELLRLLTIFDNSEEAEGLINSLRNAGQIIRDIRVEDEEDLEKALADNPIDLILCKQATPLITARQAVEFIVKSGRDIPVIVVTDLGKQDSALEALQVGARDSIELGKTDRLKHIVKREVQDLKNRRGLRRNEKMLRESEKRARDLIDSSRDAISYVHDGMHIYANHAYLKMFGYDTLDDIEGVPILDMVTSEDHSKLKEFLRKYAKGQSTDDTLDVHGQTLEGDKFKITMEFSPASMEGEACSQIIIRDQSNTKELEKQLSVLSKQDLLTGLYNRNYFLEQVDKLISQTIEDKAQGALLYIVVDDFEKLKETHGISGADLLLTDIANMLKSKIGKMGVLARFEGHHFTLLLSGSDIKQAEKISGGLVKLISDHSSDVNGKLVSPKASIGLAHINETVKNSQDALNRAVKGVHKAEKEGGNRYAIYNPAVEDLEEQEQVAHWSHRIKEALKNNQFKLLFQPIVSLHGESGEHYEVLVRMLDEENNEIPAKDFLPAANQTDLMKYIDRWVIASTFHVIADRTKQQKDTRFFIKISQGSLIDPEFLPWVSERIKAMRANITNMIFQISEETALNNLNPAKMFVNAFKQLNAKTALENYGKEPNVLQAMKQLPVDFIKVDPSLILNLAQNVENQDKVKEIASEAGERNMRVIAAAVEDANSLAVLWQCSIDFIQGHFLQEPRAELDFDFEEAF
jgi:diguanylate cyclase (GGDEF)-like protein/PAS domain S-box-containing protein